MKTKVALAAAIILGVVAMLGLRVWIKRTREQVQLATKPYPVLVAARNIASGSEVLAEHMMVETRNASAVHRLALGPADRERYRGRKVYRDIRAGDVLLASDFWQPPELEEFDKTEIGLGERAITLAVDQITGVAGLVLPHSRVDVLATFVVSQGGGQTESNFITRTLMSNVKVLAIDRQTASQAPPVGPDSYRRGGAYSSITLAVSPLEAQILTLAQSQGQGMLTLTLRNPVDDTSSVQAPPVDLHSLEDAIRRADTDRNKPKAQDTDVSGTR